MEIKPILFNTEMVKAILEGRKTKTRRVIRLKYSNTHLEMRTDKYGTRLVEKQNEEEGITIIRHPDGTTSHRLLAVMDKEPPYKCGDILWVRETWTKLFYVDPDRYTHYDQLMYFYYVDGIPDITLCDPDGFTEEDQRIRWRPSIHMPKEAARIFLIVKSVTCERLQNLDGAEAEAEGALIINNPLIREDKVTYDKIGRECFAKVWNGTLSPEKLDCMGWDSNPWVWVIEFERVDKPAGWPSSGRR